MQQSVEVVARCLVISFAQDGHFRNTIPNIKIDGKDLAGLTVIMATIF